MGSFQALGNHQHAHCCDANLNFLVMNENEEFNNNV